MGPLLFNTFLGDLFFEMNDVDFASYADDNTPFFVGNDLDEVIFKLQNASITLFQWFKDNHFLCSSKSNKSIIIENEEICNSCCEKLLGVYFDRNLIIHSDINNICKKAAQKLNALSRIISYMDFNKRKLAVDAFFSSQFNYYLIIWMCHNRTYNNNKINRLHERCLRLIYNDKHSSFEELLEKDSSVSIH